jgi:uncharacterized protein YprB with RNaseH-like and TPR domain
MAEAWMTEALVAKAKKLNHLSRKDLADALDTTEYRVRELRRELRKYEERQHLDDPFIAIWDLETTGLKGDFGRLLCGSVLSYPSGEFSSFRIDETNGGSLNKDGPLAVAIRDEIERHWMSAGWFSKGFDFSMLSTRLVVAGERKIASHLHIDPMWFYKGWRGLSMRSCSLATVAKVLGLEETKMDVPDSVWQEARYGDKYSLDILVERCESDCRLTLKILQHALSNRLMKNVQTYP